MCFWFTTFNEKVNEPIPSLVSDSEGRLEKQVEEVQSNVDLVNSRVLQLMLVQVVCFIILAVLFARRGNKVLRFDTIFYTA